MIGTYSRTVGGGGRGLVSGLRVGTVGVRLIID